MVHPHFRALVVIRYNSYGKGTLDKTLVVPDSLEMVCLSVLVEMLIGHHSRTWKNPGTNMARQDKNKNNR